MTCPDLDRLVDDAVAGLPGAQARLAAHADACAACLAEADCEHAPVPELALLADAHCPPDVVAAALAEASRPARLGSDRPAASRPATRPVWTRRIAVGVAFAAALLALRAVWPAGAPDAPPVAAMQQTSVPRPDGPAVAPEPAPAPVEVAAVTPAAPDRAGARQRIRTVARSTSPARAATSSPAPELVPVPPPAVEPAQPDDAIAAVTPADSAAARSDLLLALAIVGRAQRTADDAVASEMRRVSDALEPARTL